MTSLGVLILVLAIVGANALALVALFSWLRKRLRLVDAELRALVGPEERYLIEPAVGNYRGATARFGRVKGTGVLAVTDRRILCAKAFGARIEVPLAEVVGVREDKWFLRSYNSHQHVIVKLSDGVEVGFQARDHARWVEVLSERARRP